MFGSINKKQLKVLLKGVQNQKLITQQNIKYQVEKGRKESQLDLLVKITQNILDYEKQLVEFEDLEKMLNKRIEDSEKADQENSSL